jgi:hypothetical protein
MPDVPTPPAPPWASWIAPIIGAVMTGIGAAMLIARRLLLGFMREEFERILEAKHKENKELLDGLSRDMEHGQEDRMNIRSEIGKIATEVAYIRGRLERSG